MDDPFVVCRFERIGDLPGNPQGSIHRGPMVGQRPPLDELEHETDDAVSFFNSVNRSDIRMVERGEQPCLPLEASPRAWRRMTRAATDT